MDPVRVGQAGSGSTGNPKLSTQAFAKDATLSKIAAGGPALVKTAGHAKNMSVQTAQVALFSLGYVKNRTDIDGVFGTGFEKTVAEFQKAKGLNVKMPGQLDSVTVQALDTASSQQIAKLKAGAQPQGSKHVAYRPRVPLRLPRSRIPPTRRRAAARPCPTPQRCGAAVRRW